MSRLLVILCAAAAVAAYFMQNRSFRAAESAAIEDVGAPPATEHVIIDGKSYPKNARGVYMVKGVATFVKDDAKAAASERAAQVEAAKPARNEVVVDPARMDHLIDRGQ